MSEIAIIGLGLIGGSVAMAFKQAHPGVRITGCDVRSETLDRALALGVIDRMETAPSRAAGSADLVVLAGPVSAILSQLSEIGSTLRPGALVTDVGSTKRKILDASAALPSAVDFIGGHPMAGKPESGIAAATPDLFRGAPWCLVPRSGTAPEAVDQLQGWVRSVGATPVLTNAEAHDRAVAWVSHLPQILSLVLCHQAGAVDRALDLQGPAFKSLARLAASPYDIWKDIVETNADEVSAALTELMRGLGKASEALRQENLASLFQNARRVLGERGLPPGS
jgi:prephenate dehydrogenase